MIFFNRKSEEEFRAEIADLQNTVAKFRDDKIDAEIALSKANTYNRQALEEARANNQIVVAELRREIAILNADVVDNVGEQVHAYQVKADKQLSEDKAAFRRELRAEFQEKVSSLEKANKSLEQSAATNKGLYDGALLVITSLQAQLAKVNTLTETLVKALPTVSAKVEGGTQNVSVNAKA